jgi:hypothetical protein
VWTDTFPGLSRLQILQAQVPTTFAQVFSRVLAQNAFDDTVALPWPGRLACYPRKEIPVLADCRWHPLALFCISYFSDGVSLFAWTSLCLLLIPATQGPQACTAHPACWLRWGIANCFPWAGLHSWDYGREPLRPDEIIFLLGIGCVPLIGLREQCT